jgi:hypothetical protein
MIRIGKFSINAAHLFFLNLINIINMMPLAYIYIYMCVCVYKSNVKYKICIIIIQKHTILCECLFLFVILPTLY